MDIIREVKTKTVQEWEFRFIGDIPLGVTVDPEAGDTVVAAHTTIEFHIAERSYPGVSEKTPARHLIVYLPHVLAYETRTREIELLSPEQQAELDEWLKQSAPPKPLFTDAPIIPQSA